MIDPRALFAPRDPLQNPAVGDRVALDLHGLYEVVAVDRGVVTYATLERGRRAENRLSIDQWRAKVATGVVGRVGGGG